MALNNVIRSVPHSEWFEAPPAITTLANWDMTTTYPEPTDYTAVDGGVITLNAGYLRMDYPSHIGVGNVYNELRIPCGGATDVYIQFDARFPQAARNNPKLCKYHGIESPTENYTNITIQPTNAGTFRMYRVLFGDGTMFNKDPVSGTPEANDNSTAFNFLNDEPWLFGRNEGVATVVQHSLTDFIWTDTNWHTFKIHVKLNSGTTALNEVNDGEFYVEIDGQVYLHVTDCYNKHYSNNGFEKISLGDWSENFGAYALDFRNVKGSLGGWL